MFILVMGSSRVKIPWDTSWYAHVLCNWQNACFWQVYRQILWQLIETVFTGPARWQHLLAVLTNVPDLMLHLTWQGQAPSTTYWRLQIICSHFQVNVYCGCSQMYRYVLFCISADVDRSNNTTKKTANKNWGRVTV